MTIGSGGGGSGLQAGLPSKIKKQLRQYAKEGKTPKVIVGSREARALLFEEIDRVYPMPDTSVKRIIDRGDNLYVDFGTHVKTSGYPSGTNASEAEKRGVKKWLLWR